MLLFMNEICSTYQWANSIRHKTVEQHRENCQRGCNMGVTLFWTNLLPINEQPCSQGRLTTRVRIKTQAGMTVYLVIHRHLPCHAVAIAAIRSINAVPSPGQPCHCLSCHVFAQSAMYITSACVYMPQLAFICLSYQLFASAASFCPSCRAIIWTAMSSPKPLCFVVFS